MRRNFFGGLGFSLAIVVLASPNGRAQLPPEILDHYKLLPRASTLYQSGGIAGVKNVYRLTGSYDLQHSAGWSATNSFQNAEVWGAIISPNPTPAVVLDVDQLLNLEGLKGEALPVAAPFDVYQFTGTIDDGSTIRLLGSVIGPWMYLRGNTQPPAGSADYFIYTINALARSPRPFADLNDDGSVDAADYVVLRKNIAAANPDHVSLDDWFEQFGESVPDLAAYDTIMTAALGSLSPTSEVPETTSWLLFTWGNMALFGLGRRRHRCATSIGCSKHRQIILPRKLISP